MSVLDDFAATAFHNDLLVAENAGLRQRVIFTESFETLRYKLGLAEEAAFSLRASHSAALSALEGERRAVARAERAEAELATARAGQEREP